MRRLITVTVGVDGSITAESSGEPGPDCLDDYDTILRLLDGATVIDSRLTPAYFATEGRALVQDTVQDWEQA